MWSIVIFDDENAVEAVPAHWMKNNLCAWPKKDTKKHLLRRTIPNKFNFNYVKSRLLKKGIDDLESMELDFDRSIPLMTPPKPQKTVTNHNFHHELDYNYKESSSIENRKTPSLNSKLNIPGSRFSYEGHNNDQMSDRSPSKVKRILFKPRSTSIQENKSPSTSSIIPEKTHEISSIIYTSCSPFKVSSQDNYQSLLIPDEHEEIVFSAPDEVPDICGFLGDKLNSVDNDPDLGLYDDVRNYMYEGEGNSVGSLSSLASGTDDGDLNFDYLSNFGPRFRKLADMYGEDPSDEESETYRNTHPESWC
ncbi:hypothetical protein ACI65C_001889 [Semiaphis heraclei]